MQDLKTVIKILKAISDEGRLRIISLLSRRKDLCVCEIRELIGLSQSTISSHLKKLENSGLVNFSKDGKWINYNLDPNLDSEIKKLLKGIISIIKDDPRLRDDFTRLGTAKREDICNR
jgi:ArsR family transcriptional regulator, arsenate/arsenite/antimonite-responsive transcriptional repressor